MWRKIRRTGRRFKEWNDRFAEWTGRVLSWSIWLTIMTVGTATWMLVNALEHGKLDPDYIKLMLVLTITTALDAAATKLFQLALRSADEKRDAQWMEQLSAVANLTVAIRESVDGAAERDAAMREVVVKILDALEGKPEGVTAA